MQKKIKVGFDFDGVILYNPARVIRPLMSLLKKKHLVKRKQLQFYIPKTKKEQFLWYLFHKSSIYPARGLKDIKQLVNNNKIEAYIITGRFSHLKKDFDAWLKKIGADKIFTACYLNEKDEQPHFFKERMIKKLDLDVFIEDNADIVDYLAGIFSKQKPLTKIYWIYNIFDKRLNFDHKYPTLYKAVSKLKTFRKKS